MARSGAAPSSAAAAAVAGALLAQLLPFVPGGIPAARAAWCWTADPPKCDAPVVTDGSCEEGSVLAAGELCTPVCQGGKVPSCTHASVQCPPELGGNGCINDIGPQGWWTPCGFGTVCLSKIQMGSALYADYGTFSCVEPSAVTRPCGNATMPQLTVVSPGATMDAATLAFLGCLLLLVAVGALLVRVPSTGATRQFFKPGLANFSLANIVGMLLVLAGLIAFAAGLSAGQSSLQVVFITGLTTGLASSLPIWWACYRAGVHSVLKMSREAAWRIHIFFGDLTLVFGVAHGACAFAEGIDIVGNAFFLLGLLGLVLMLVGVLPAGLHHAAPKVMKYDYFKVLHFLSMLGYLLALVHMIDHASKFKTVRSIAVTVVNILALVVLIVQKVFVKFTAASVSVKDVEVLEEQCGRHLFLRLSAPGFPKPAPGQWGHLAVPSVSAVPHPFTLVPGEQSDEVQIFMKVSGAFTSGLANSCAKGPAGACKMSLEGPYGEPPLPSLKVDAVAFVLGGVGVTPALSLLAEARKMCGERVFFYWALRSPGLLRRCAPLLQTSLLLRSSCIRISGATSGGANLPLEAREGHEDVGQWLASASADLQAQGARSALLFCCGPAPLSTAATAAVGRLADGVAWHVHVEQFLFLPDPPKCGGGPGRRGGGGGGSATVQVIGASSG